MNANRPTGPEEENITVAGLDSGLIFRLAHNGNIFRLRAVNRR